MKNSLNAFSKKRGFLYQLITQSTLFSWLFGGILIAMCTTGVYCVLRKFDFLDFNSACFIAKLLISASFTAFGLLIVLICIYALPHLYAAIEYEIKHILALRNYTRLPLTADEVKQGIDAGLFSNRNEYLKFIENKMSYCSKIYSPSSVYFDFNDVLNLLKSIKEVFDEDEILLSWTSKKSDDINGQFKENNITSDYWHFLNNICPVKGFDLESLFKDLPPSLNQEIFISLSDEYEDAISFSIVCTDKCGSRRKKIIVRLGHERTDRVFYNKFYSK